MKFEVMIFCCLGFALLLSVPSSLHSILFSLFYYWESWFYMFMAELNTFFVCAFCFMLLVKCRSVGKWRSKILSSYPVLGLGSGIFRFLAVRWKWLGGLRCLYELIRVGMFEPKVVRGLEEKVLKPCTNNKAISWKNNKNCIDLEICYFPNYFKICVSVLDVFMNVIAFCYMFIMHRIFQYLVRPEFSIVFVYHPHNFFVL